MAENQESKIRKGQAFNLAVNDAVSNKQENNPKYIYKRFIYYHTLADVVQGSDFDLIQKVIDSKDFDKVIKQLAEALK
jgi:hypothetical protein